MEKYLVICAATTLLRKDVFTKVAALFTILSYVSTTFIINRFDLTESILLSNLSDSFILGLLLFFVKNIKHKLGILFCVCIKIFSIFIWQYPFSVPQYISYYILDYADVIILETLFMICASDLNFKKFTDYMYTIFIICAILLF